MTRIFVRRNVEDSYDCDVVFQSGKNLLTGETPFRKQFGPLTSLESDLLLIASSVFAADRCTKRGDREELTRSIELRIPVVNIGRIQPCAVNIERVLRKLSNDSWRIVLRQQQGSVEQPAKGTASNGATLLFSGGLDSFAAAFEFGSKQSELQLVSHITKNPQTIGAQNALVELLQARGLVLPHRQFLVSSRPTSPTPNLQHDAESSQRTRSFLFLVLAALCARRAGHRDLLMMAENGQMAIHLPLTQGRIGAFSTHTAHPDVLVSVQELLQAVLDVPIKIVNPYAGKTKAEVIEQVCRDMPSALGTTTSCWKNSRLPASATHCGVCIPCYVRRIAIETHMPDPTAYARNAWVESVASMPPDDDARRNLVDYAEFIKRMLTFPEAELMVEWPELYSPNINAPAAIQMYKRAALEATAVFNQYPAVAAVLT